CRRAQEERCGRTVAWDKCVERMQCLPARDSYGSSRAMNFRAEGTQCQLAVIARGDWLFHSRLSVSEKSSKQQAGLDLSTGYGDGVVDAFQSRTRNAQWSMVVGGGNLSAHPAKRRHHALHGPPRQRLVSNQLAAEGLCGYDARQHAHGRA